MRDLAQMKVASVRQCAGMPNPRLRILITSLVRHLQNYVYDVGLTAEEWNYAINFITSSGQIHGSSQEFILFLQNLELTIGHQQQESAAQIDSRAGAAKCP